MFTLTQIKAAHAKVKSGADFPVYIQDLIELGVRNYQTIVSDGHVVYVGANNYSVITPSNYPSVSVAALPNKERFIEFLVQHQDGQSDYLSFCLQAAACGIEKWNVDCNAMTCTYFSSTGTALLIEKIPS